MTSRAVGLAMLLTLLYHAAPAAAQTTPGQCEIRENERIQRRLEGGVPMIYITGPFRITCAGGEDLRALSGTVNEMTREIVLTGNVNFQDPTQTLTSDNATYMASLGRLYATGNVVFVNREEGSTIRGPELEYFRPTDDRPEAIVNAAQRPRLTLLPRQPGAGAAAGEGAEPMEIDADRVSIVGQDELSAYGDVIIRRSDLHATAEEAQYDARTEELELRRSAVIRSDRFHLAGEVVRAQMPDGELRYVHANREAVLVGDELEVDAPDLQLFFERDLLQRAVARAPLAADGSRSGRAVATARAFRLEGDSIDAATPDQQVDQVVAIGRARGESLDPTTRQVLQPADTGTADLLVAEVQQLAAQDTVAIDTIAPRSAALATALVDRDWIVGDTIIGFFEPADPRVGAIEAADTGAVLRRIIAHGMAQSLYRVEAQGDSEGDRPAINYLAGELIELSFEGGELQVAEVTGLRQGIYLEPTPSANPPAGTAPPPAITPSTPDPTSAEESE